MIENINSIDDVIQRREIMMNIDVTIDKYLVNEGFLKNLITKGAIKMRGYDNKEYVIPSVDYDPAKETTSNYGEKQIQQAIDTLPDQFKTVIILREVQQLSYEEISQILGISIGTVKSRINRGRLRLQKLLKELKEQ